MPLPSSCSFRVLDFWLVGWFGDLISYRYADDIANSEVSLCVSDVSSLSLTPNIRANIDGE